MSVFVMFMTLTRKHPQKPSMKCSGMILAVLWINSGCYRETWSPWCRNRFL